MSREDRHYGQRIRGDKVFRDEDRGCKQGPIFTRGGLGRRQESE